MLVGLSRASIAHGRSVHEFDTVGFFSSAASFPAIFFLERSKGKISRTIVPWIPADTLLFRHYGAKLAEHGFDDAEVAVSLDEPQLEAMFGLIGCRKIGHQFLLMNSIAALKHQHDLREAATKVGDMSGVGNAAGNPTRSPIRRIAEMAEQQNRNVVSRSNRNSFAAPAPAIEVGGVGPVDPEGIAEHRGRIDRPPVAVARPRRHANSPTSSTVRPPFSVYRSTSAPKVIPLPTKRGATPTVVQPVTAVAMPRGLFVGPEAEKAASVSLLNASSSASPPPGFSPSAVRPATTPVGIFDRRGAAGGFGASSPVIMQRIDQHTSATVGGTSTPPANIRLNIGRDSVVPNSSPSTGLSTSPVASNKPPTVGTTLQSTHSYQQLVSLLKQQTPRIVSGLDGDTHIILRENGSIRLFSQ